MDLNHWVMHPVASVPTIIHTNRSIQHTQSKNNPYIHQEVEGNSSSAAYMHEQLTTIAAFCEYYKIIYFCLTMLLLYLYFMARKLLKLTRHLPLYV
jgi:hypothetical protein